MLIRKPYQLLVVSWEISVHPLYLTRGTHGTQNAGGLYFFSYAEIQTMNAN